MNQNICFLKSTLILSSALFLNLNGNAQTCLDYKKADKLTLEIATYPLIHDKVGTEFYTMKPKKKVEKAEEYSNDLNSGKVKPASTYTLDYTITDIDANGEYELSTTIAGQTYKSHLNCDDKNLYIIRIKGAMLPTVYNGETLGFSTKGIQIVPKNIKVGDVTPGYVDESILTFEKSDIQKTTFAIGDADYNPVSGSMTTSTYTGYVQARVNYSVKGKTLVLYQGGVVYGEETLTISGKQYKCFKVRTEIWTKNDTKANTKYELDNWFGDAAFNKQVHGQIMAVAAKANERVKANMDDMLGANKAGYIVSYKEEWICPTAGVLKSNNYDQWGCLQTTITTKAIN
jgi:hypothetical protein